MAYVVGLAGTATLEANKKLGFKVGLQSALDTISTAKTATSGTFYLTSDTHRLYIGDKNGDLAPVNQGIVTVESISALNNIGGDKDAEGAFAYVTEGNILCVRSGKKWVQINNNTEVENFTAIVAARTGGGATVSHEITENGKAHKATFDIVPGKNVTISNTGSAITINAADAPEYTLDVTSTTANNAVSGITVDLKKDGTSAGTAFEVAPGDNIQITKSGNKYTVAANIKGVSDKVITSTDFSNLAEGFDFTLTQASGDTISASTKLNPSIKIGDADAVTFKNGVATLDAYSKTQVDSLLKDKIKDLNALTYKGAVAAADGLPDGTTVKVAIGDVYMQKDSGKMNGITGAASTDAGTLWIAQAKAGYSEDSTGDLPAAGIEWVQVENYNNDTQYTFTNSGVTNGVTATVKSTSSSDPDAKEVGHLTIQASDNLNASYTNNTLTIKHNKLTPAAKNSSTVTDSAQYLFTSPTGFLEDLSYDAYGHVSTFTKKGFQVEGIGISETQATKVGTPVTAAGVTSVTTTQKIQAASTVNNTPFGSEISISNTVSSESLQVTAGTGGAKIDLVWGSF